MGSPEVPCQDGEETTSEPGITTHLFFFLLNYKGLGLHSELIKGLEMGVGQDCMKNCSLPSNFTI